MTPSELRVRKVSHRGQVRGMDAQSALGAARARDARGIRPRAAAPGLARPRVSDRRAFWARTRRRALPKALSGGAAARRSAAPTRTNPRVTERGQEIGWFGLARTHRGLASEHHDRRLAILSPDRLPDRALRPPHCRLRYRAPRHRLHLGTLARAARRSRRSRTPPASRRTSCITCSAAGPG